MKKILILGLLFNVAVMAGEPTTKTTDYTDWIECVARLKPVPKPVGKVFKTKPIRTVVLPGDGLVANEGRKEGIFVGKGKQCLFYPGMNVQDEDLDLEKVNALKGGDFCDAEKFEIQLRDETLRRIRKMFNSYKKSKILLSEKDRVDGYVLPLRACASFVPEFLKQDVADALAQFGEKPTTTDGDVPRDAHPMADPFDKPATH